LIRKIDFLYPSEKFFFEWDTIITKVVKRQILSYQFFQQTFNNENRNDEGYLGVVEIPNLCYSSSKKLTT
jgi:hypothetical protein